MASCVSVLSSVNAPLFVLSSSSSPLSDHYSLHTSLDVIEEKTGSPQHAKKAADARDLYLGALYATEKKKVTTLLSIVYCFTTGPA